MTIATFTLRSATTQAAAPFTLGHAFKKGDVPAGAQVVASIADFQCTPKNAWPDGSLKFAVLAGRAAITGGTPLAVNLSIGTPAAGSALGTAGIATSATTDCGTFGAVTWSGTDWASPFMTWVSGPKMSSFIYRKPVGSDAHLVAWLEVRVFSGGELQVLPWIENGYWMVASPTNKSATYTFTLGGTALFSQLVDLKHHARTPLINGSATAYWLGADPGVTPRHDVAYMQATELVPTYSVTRSATGLGTLPTTYVPFQRGGILYTDNGYGDDKMTNSGYERPIGLLGEHDVAYLVCNDQPELLYQAVMRNGYSAGRYPVHYRDETTNRAPVMSAYPQVTVTNPDVANLGAGNSTTPTPTGGSVAIWDGAHHPSLGFMAYLLSGRFYHMETVQLVAVGNYFTINYHNSRANSNGRLIPDYGSVQTRSAAWSMRSMAQALCVTPDSDTAMVSSIKAVVETVISYYHATFVAQANNPFGIIEPGETYTPAADGWQLVAIWQQDFFTAVYGYMQALGLPIASAVATKLAAFFQWKAKSVVGRFGTTADFRFENADVYAMAVSSAALPNYQTGAGPWATDWAQISAHTFVSPISGVDNTSWNSSTANLLGGEYSSDVWCRSMWGNLHPALAYAVRFAVPGAAAALAKLQGASNYSAITTGFAAAPVWSVAPSGQTTSGAIVTTPGPSFIWDSVTPFTNGFVWDTVRGLGLRGMDLPSSGTDGTTPWYDALSLPADNLSEIRIVVTTQPAHGALTLYGDGSMGYANSDGQNDSFVWQGYQDGPNKGSATTSLLYASTVSGVTVSPATATGSTTFSATVSGTNSPSQVVTWAASAGSITSGGVFTAPAPTTAIQTITVTATSTQDGTKSGAATVTIAAAPVSVITGVTITPAGATVASGATQQFSATVLGSNSPSQAVTWSASGAGSIGTSGLYTAPVATGSTQACTITATASDGTHSASVTATVPAAVNLPTVTGVSVTPSAPVLAGGATQAFAATVSGANSPSQAVTWATTLGAIDASTGVLTAPATTSSMQSGTVTATSTQDGTKSGTASFTVAAAGVVVPPAPTVTSVTVSPASSTINAGGARQFSVVVDGANSPGQGVTWSATSGSINSSGLFAPPSATIVLQTVTITATSTVDGTKAGQAIIYVNASAVSAIVADGNMLELAADDTVANPADSNYYMRGRQVFIDKDPDAIIFYGVNLAAYLARAGNAITLTGVTAIPVSVDVTIEAAVQGSKLVVQLSGGINALLLTDPDAAPRCTFHFTLSNGDTDDFTIWLNIIDR